MFISRSLAHSLYRARWSVFILNLNCFLTIYLAGSMDGGMVSVIFQCSFLSSWRLESEVLSCSCRLEMFLILSRFFAIRVRSWFLSTWQACSGQLAMPVSRQLNSSLISCFLQRQKCQLLAIHSFYINSRKQYNCYYTNMDCVYMVNI